MNDAAADDTPRGVAISLMIVVPPLLPIVFFLIEWGVAWITLGHVPRPMFDDPKSISTTSDVLHLFTGLSLFAAVPLCAVGVIGVFVQWGASWKAVVMTGLGAFLCFGTIAILGNLPWDAFGWWMD